MLDAYSEIVEETTVRMEVRGTCQASCSLSYLTCQLIGPFGMFKTGLSSTHAVRGITVTVSLLMGTRDETA